MAITEISIIIPIIAALAMAAAFLEQAHELGPGFLRGVLATEFLLAVSPAARGDDGGDARID